MTFFGLSTIALCAVGEVPWRRLGWAVIAGAQGLALVVPLLYVQLDVAGRLTRTANYGNGIAVGTLAMLLPAPLTTAPHPNGWGSFHAESMGEFYYSGTLFSAAALLAGMLLAVIRGRRLPLAPNLWLFAAVVAFLLALGHAAGLWSLVSLLPVFGAINNHPFRLLPEVIFFGMLAGGLFAQRLAGAGPAGTHVGTGLAVAVIVLLLWHVDHCRPSFYSYAERPYPPLPASMQTLLADAPNVLPESRVFSMVRERSASDGYLKSLKHCLGTAYHIPSLDGYDPIVDTSQPFSGVKRRLYYDPAGTMELLGVGWTITGELGIEPAWLPGTLNLDCRGEPRPPFSHPLDGRGSAPWRRHGWKWAQ